METICQHYKQTNTQQNKLAKKILTKIEQTNGNANAQKKLKTNKTNTYFMINELLNK